MGRGSGCSPAHVWVLDPAKLDIEDAADWSRREGMSAQESGRGCILEPQGGGSSCCCRRSQRRSFRTGISSSHWQYGSMGEALCGPRHLLPTADMALLDCLEKRTVTSRPPEAVLSFGLNARLRVNLAPSITTGLTNQEPIGTQVPQPVWMLSDHGSRPEVRNKYSLGKRFVLIRPQFQSVEIPETFHDSLNKLNTSVKANMLLNTFRYLKGS